jgi:4-hydroxy-tetrahydrodipicolinate synthase
MISGSIVALVTPMRHDGEVDWPVLSALVDMHIAAGTSGIVAVGTTGESATLDVEEHIAVVRHVVDQVKGRITVIAGTGANSTKEAIELTQAAKDVKADACLLVTPYYNKPTQEGLFLHHKAIADAVSIPQILYNVPGRTACDMQADTVERLSKISNIIGIKEATGNVERGREIVARCRKDFVLCSGDDASFVDLLEIGGRGNISVTANVAPKAMADICSAALKGDFARARELNAPLLALHKDLFCEANPIPVKWAMWKMGLMDDGIRLPLTLLSERYQPVVVEALQKAGLING